MAEDMDVDQEPPMESEQPVIQSEPEEKVEYNPSATDENETATTLPVEATMDVGAAFQFVDDALRAFQSDVSEATSTAEELLAKHKEAQEALFEEFSQRSLELMKQYNSEISPLGERITNSKKPLSDIFLNKHVSIPCTWLQSRTQNKVMGGNPMTNPTYGRGVPIPSYDAYSQGYGGGGTWGQTQWTYKHSTKRNGENRFQPLDVAGDPKEIVMNLFRDMKDEVVRKRQEEERKAQAEEQKARLEEQRILGATNLLGIAPWLTIDQARAVMEMKDDNIEQATNWLFSTDQMESIMAISKHIASKNNTESPLFSTIMNAISNEVGGDGDVAMTDAHHVLAPGVLNRSVTDGDEKRVTFLIIKVTDDGKLILQGVLDRNEIPLDQGQARILSLTYEELMNSRMLFVNDERIAALTTTNILKIIFRKDETTNEFTPLSIEPVVRVQEYNMNFSNDGISKVTHRTDGLVLYRGILDSGSTGLFALNQPIELYSQVLDEVTHNILSIVVHDLSEDITVDVNNITNTATSIEDYKSNFTRDAMGRALGYRIIVNNQRVVAILSPVGDTVKELPFIEHIVPAEESLVSLPNGKLGIVRNIPTGLIVTNDPDRANAISENSKRCQFPSVTSTTYHAMGRHVADLDGLIDVEVVKDGENWIIREPRGEAHVVSTITPADDMKQIEFIVMKEAMSTNTTQVFREKVAGIESIVAAVRTRSPGPNGETPAQLLSKAQSEVNEAKSMMQQDEIQADQELVASATQQLRDFERELRGLRFEVNMNQM